MDYDLADRTKALKPNEPRINFKNHKNNFHNNFAVRLICSTKPDIGRIGKLILDTILPLTALNLLN